MITKILTGHINIIQTLCLDQRKNILYSAGEDEKIILWDIIEFKKIQEINQHDHIYLMCLSECKRFLFCATKNKHIKIWNSVTKQQICELEGHQDRITGLCVFENNLYSAGRDKKIMKWKLDLDLNLGAI